MAHMSVGKYSARCRHCRTQLLHF